MRIEGGNYIVKAERERKEIVHVGVDESCIRQAISLLCFRKSLGSSDGRSGDAADDKDGI